MSNINWSRVTFMSLFGTLFVLAFLLYSTTASAYEVPKDATIKVFDANGKQIGEMSRSEYKVVKIENDAKVIKQRLVEKKYRKKHNSIILHAGHGRTGELSTGHNGSSHTVRAREGMVGGATICHTKDTAGVCLSGFTNETVVIGIKKDF